jgi:hypothetical protein
VFTPRSFLLYVNKVITLFSRVSSLLIPREKGAEKSLLHTHALLHLHLSHTNPLASVLHLRPFRASERLLLHNPIDHFLSPPKEEVAVFVAAVSSQAEHLFLPESEARGAHHGLSILGTDG